VSASRIVSLRPAPVRRATLAVALAATIHPAAAFAQDAEASDEIVVIGQPLANVNPNANAKAPFKIEVSADDKFTEPLRDTPKTVVAIPKEVMSDMGATSFREVVRSTPGVTLGTGEGGNAFGDRIFIRGFEARNDVYVDGLRDPGVTSREIFAVEQIEVIKGPSGNFGGRGTTGGLVSLQTKRPQMDNDFVVLEGGVGTDHYYRATVDSNYGISEKLAVRVNGLWHSADTPGRDHVFSDRWGVAVSTQWQPSDTVSLIADYYGYRLDGMSDYGHPYESAAFNDGDGGGVPNESVPVDLSNFYGAVGRDFLDNGADIGTLTFKAKPTEALTLRAVARYGRTWNYYVVSVPRAPRKVAATPSAADKAYGFMPGQLVVDTGSPQRHGDNDSFAALADATWRFGTGGIEHTLVVGLEGSSEKVVNRRYSFPAFVEDANGNQIGTPSGFSRDLFNPNPILGYSIPAVLDPAAVPATVKVDAMGYYAIDTIKFSPQWIATLGLRYDTFDIRSYGSNYDRSSSLNFLNGQASLLYKPIEAVSVYASFSTSSNPAGEQLDSTAADYGGLAAGLENLEPERNKAYELGAKWEFSPELLATAAVFQIDKENARENVGGGVYQLVGKLRARGLEFGVAGNITSRWSVFGGYTLLDAKITESNNPANVGSRFPNVPKYTYSMLSSYNLTDWLRIGGQAYYQGKLFGGTYATTATSVPGYWRFDAVAEARFGKVDVRLNVLNIFDKRYYDAIYRSGSPFSYVAPGRSATLTAKIAL
jgi:catecholate siderophore receptor